MPESRLIDLVPHPRNIPDAIAVTCGYTSGKTELALDFRISGAIARVLVPPPRQPGPADGLWQHTCFEAFVAIAGASAYREFNFSPSGQWAIYDFSDYRLRVPMCGAPIAPRLDCKQDEGGLRLHAIIPLEALPSNEPRTTLEIGLAAVIELDDGSHTHWALSHPCDQPDFHHRQGFTLELQRGQPRSMENAT